MEEVIHQEIATRVKSKLQYDERIEATGINVFADNSGNVTLTGIVPSLDQKKFAEQEAKRVRAVRNVINELVVSTEGFDDQEIKKRAEKRLAAYQGIDESKIEVDSIKGQIHLKGSVDAYHKKKKVTELMSTLPHVGEIHNELTVTPNRNITDEAIAGHITESLRLSSVVDPELVVIEVNNGDVILSGLVDRLYQKDSVEKTASHTAGVKSVVNKIRLK